MGKLKTKNWRALENIKMEWDNGKMDPKAKKKPKNIVMNIKTMKYRTEWLWGKEKC